MKDKIITTLYIIGIIGVCIGLVSRSIKWEYAPYAVTISATLIALAQINTPLGDMEKSLKRLYRNQIFASLFLIASGACMLYTRGNEWIVLASIAALIYLYTAFRIPILEKKNKEK